MPQIPVEFEHEGKNYVGTLDEVPGMGQKIWHLMIDDYYKGCLLHTDQGFSFHGRFPSLTDTFADKVILWYS